MLQIGAKKKAVPDDPEQMLLDCHERIRQFTSLARHLASGTAASDAEVQDAAARVHRYYAVALGLHQADEEQSMAPRLEGFAPAAALQAMRDQHVVLEASAERLLPQWDAVARDAAQRRVLRAEDVAALDKLWDEHLRLEETTIFPGLRQLPPDVRATLVAEFRGRRTK